MTITLPLVRRLSRDMMPQPSIPREPCPALPFTKTA